MQQTMVAHINDVMAYKKCRRLWNWSSLLRNSLEPKAPHAPFFIGRAVHYVIEQLRGDATPPLTSLSTFLRKELNPLRQDAFTWPIYREDIKQQVHLIRALIRQYHEWSVKNRGPFADNNLEPLAQEIIFGDSKDPLAFPAVLLKDRNGVPYKPHVYLAGRFDELVRHRMHGTVWLGETKTCRSIEERTALLWHDEQATAYCYAAQELFNEPVAGVVYTLLRKKIASRPEVLKKGTLSQDKRIDTTVGTYRKAIYDLHGEVSDEFVESHYGDILFHIGNFAKPFVDRIAIERSPQQIALFVEELHATVLEMYNPSTYINATRTWSCPGCHFRQPCLSADTGDLQQLDLQLEHSYKRRTQQEIDAKEL